jgi:hypothetical protein
LVLARKEVIVLNPELRARLKVRWERRRDVAGLAQVSFYRHRFSTWTGAFSHFGTAMAQSISSRPWLGMLIVASLAIFVFALIGAFLRIRTLTPDVLGSISVALLQNRIRGVAGSSTWDFDTWARSLRDTKLYLADVETNAEYGSIALATSKRDVHVGLINGRKYI